MTTALLLYGLVIAGLLGGAAHFLDRALRALGRPARWVWIVGLAGGVLAPVAARVLPPRAPSGSLEWPSGTLPAAHVQDVTAKVQETGPWLPPSILDGPLLFFWIASAAVLALLLLGAGLRLWRRRRRWEHREVAGERVLVSNGLGPALLGVLRPRIVLPRWTLDLDEERLDLVLRHEREHRRAGDPAVLAAGVLAVLTCPLNPALWWCFRRLRLAVEADCDARVLADGVHPKRYGMLLVDVATRAGTGPYPAPALVERGSTFLERRLKMIGRRGSKKTWVSPILGAMAAGFLLILACETPIPPRPTADSEGDAPSPSEDPSAEVKLHGTTLAETGSEPLIYVDGVRVGLEADLDDPLSPSDIERIEVTKGTAAKALFGEEASAGVIQIFTKDGLRGEGEGDTLRIQQLPGSEVQEINKDTLRSFIVGRDTVGRFRYDSVRVLSPGGSDEEPGAALETPLVIIDGVIAESGDWQGMVDATDIEKIEVIKGKAAMAVYGPEGANGVILITLKH